MGHYDGHVYGDWEPRLLAETQKPYFSALQEFVRAERNQFDVFPDDSQVFESLRLTSYEKTKVVILGQDPYHGEGQAHGLAFSVQPGIAPPPSLRNIMKELRDDLDMPHAQSGSLASWAEQGVLLLNTTLTVRAHAAASHQGRGWETFTDHIISLINKKQERCVFVLWGASARKKKSLITNELHVVLESAHPSPLSARHGFFGSRPFSRANTALRAANRGEIDWVLR